MAISFNEISATGRTPGTYVEIDSSRAIQGTPAQPHVILLIGQGLAAGSAAEGEIKEILNSDQGEEYWGRGSVMSAMVKAGKGANAFTPMFGVSLDDAGAATAGTQTLTFAGTATETRELALYIHGVRIAIPITTGDAHTDVSAAMDAAIVAAQTTKELQMTSGEAAGVVTLTARNKGTLGNAIDVRHSYNDGEGLAAGITLAIAAGVVGATDPDIATAIAAIGDTQYHTIISAFPDATNAALLEAEMLARWGPYPNNDGHVFHGFVGSLSDHTTYGALRNSPFVSCGSGGLCPTTPWEIAAVLGAVDAKEPDPARPRQTLPLPGIMAPAREDRFTQVERESLLNNGMATIVYDPAGNAYIERLITQFQTDALSNDSTVYLDITTPRTLSRLRYDFRTRMTTKYPRHKLADDGTNFDPGQAVVTPNVARAEAYDLFLNFWEPAGLVEDFDDFEENLIVERNDGDVNRLDVQLCPDLMNQLRIVAAQIQFRL